jgi:hypothetical protein
MRRAPMTWWDEYYLISAFQSTSQMNYTKSWNLECILTQKLHILMPGFFQKVQRLY